MNFRLVLAGILAGVLIMGFPRGEIVLADLESVPRLELSQASETSTTPRETSAISNASPYGVIYQRNCFRLNPPPAPTGPQAAATESPRLKITGFMKNTNGVRVLLALFPKDPKDQMKYFNLGEGEREDILDVVKISIENEQAEVLLNGNTRLTLSLKTNGLTSGVALLPPPVQPTPGISSRVIPNHMLQLQPTSSSAP